MKAEHIVNMLEQRIHSLHHELITARRENFPKNHIEGFRNRFDELILFYQEITGMSFIEVCGKLSIPPSDVSVGVSE